MAQRISTGTAKAAVTRYCQETMEDYSPLSMRFTWVDTWTMHVETNVGEIFEVIESGDKILIADRTYSKADLLKDYAIAKGRGAPVAYIKDSLGRTKRLNPMSQGHQPTAATDFKWPWKQ